MIDSLLTDLSALGWLVNNAYQPDAGLWRVSLRKPAEEGDWFSEWAEAPTFAEALEDCMSKLSEATFEDHPSTTFIIEPTRPSLLSALTLHFAPSAPIRRRV